MKRRTCVAAALAGIALCTSGGAAWAGAPYTVSVAGSESGDYPIRASSTDVHFRVLAFGFIPVDWYCSKVEFTGKVHAGANTTGGDLATLESSTWQGCDYASSPWAITADHAVPWSLNLTGTATAGTTDVIPGNVSGVNLDVAIASPSCNFTLTGRFDTALDEATQLIVVSDNDGLLNLTVPAGGCTLFATGDPVDPDGTFAVKTYADQTDLDNDLPISGTPIDIG